MKDLFFVTGNPNKAKEAENILGQRINQIDIDIDEIQAIDVEDIVKDKAKRAYQEIKKPVFVEDNGLYLKAWQGFPGALIKWVLKTLGNEKIIQFLGNDDCSASAKVAICLYDGKNFQIFVDEIKGQITTQPRGEHGFGWDPIFQPDGYEKTFAEMTADEKDTISMRKIALEKLKDYLENKN